MKNVIQEIPEEQKKILIESLNLLESVLKNLNIDSQEKQYKLFDILTLKAMLNKTELIVKIPFNVYDSFTAINGIDFPEYC